MKRKEATPNPTPLPSRAETHSVRHRSLAVTAALGRARRGLRVQARRDPLRSPRRRQSRQPPSTIDGAVIEAWKHEAFHDERNRKDLFVTFLCFCDDRFVDAGDTRIDLRNSPDLVARSIGRPAN